MSLLRIEACIEELLYIIFERLRKENLLTHEVQKCLCTKRKYSVAYNFHRLLVFEVYILTKKLAVIPLRPQLLEKQIRSGYFSLGNFGT